MNPSSAAPGSVLKALFSSLVGQSLPVRAMRVAAQVVTRWSEREAAPAAPVAAPPAAPAPGTAEAVPLRPISRELRYRDTAWIPRILWALEWSRRSAPGGGPGVTASDVARVLRDHGGMDVQASNVGRAFRDLLDDERAAGLWTAHDKRYRISAEGTRLLEGLVGAS